MGLQNGLGSNERDRADPRLTSLFTGIKRCEEKPVSAGNGALAAVTKPCLLHRASKSIMEHVAQGSGDCGSIPHLVVRQWLTPAAVGTIPTHTLHFATSVLLASTPGIRHGKWRKAGWLRSRERSSAMTPAR
jgi:hypothetical protein